MEVVNEYVGVAFVTRHALERWKERGRQEDDLAAHFAAAVPFGAQRGKAVLLAREEFVFVTTVKKGGDDRIVTTVLTRDMAIANVQAFHAAHAFRGSDVPPVPPATTALAAAPSFAGGLVGAADPALVAAAQSTAADAYLAKPKKAKVSGGEWRTQLARIWSASEEQLEAMLRATESPFFPAVEHELALRRRVEKLRKHGELMSASRDALREALKQVVSEEQLQEIYRLNDEKERRRGLRPAKE